MHQCVSSDASTGWLNGCRTALRDIGGDEDGESPMQRDAAWSAESLRREEEGRDEEDGGSGRRRKKAMSEKDVAEERGIRMRLLEANRTSRGSKTGGILSFTGLVVVGNGNVRARTPALACAA